MIAELLLGHLGNLHAYEQVLVLLLAFGPLVLLVVSIRIARSRRESENEETPPSTSG